MSYYDYMQTRTREIEKASFCTLIMAAIKKADTFNLEKLSIVFPEIVEEVRARYNAPGARLPSDEPTLFDQVRSRHHRTGTTIETVEVSIQDIVDKGEKA